MVILNAIPHQHGADLAPTICSARSLRGQLVAIIRSETKGLGGKGIRGRLPFFGNAGAGRESTCVVAL